MPHHTGVGLRQKSTQKVSRILWMDTKAEFWHAFSKWIYWFEPTEVISLKMQKHAINTLKIRVATRLYSEIEKTGFKQKHELLFFKIYWDKQWGHLVSSSGGVRGRRPRRRYRRHAFDSLRPGSRCPPCSEKIKKFHQRNIEKICELYTKSLLL